MEISGKAHCLGEFLAGDYGNGRDFYNGCLKFARWLVQNPDDAKDLVGEAYFRAIRSGGGYKYPIPKSSEKTEESGRARNYLYGIIRNIHLDKLRRKKHEGTQFDLLEGIVAGNGRLKREQSQPGEIVIQEETKRIVRDGILNLPARNREVIFMYYFLGMNQAKIAESIGRSKGTVGGRLKRAEELLVERIGTKYPEMMVA